MKLFFLSIYFLLSFNLCTSQSIKLEMSKKNKASTSIILMIADGAGLSQITAAIYKNENKSHLESFKVVGLQKTHAVNSLITDSAASGTAMACGTKTVNGAIVTKDQRVVHVSLCPKRVDLSRLAITSAP